MRSLTLALALTAPGALDAAERFDLVVRGGTVYDGSGDAPRRADVGIRGDRIAAIGDLKGAEGATLIDASGLAVAPGFINMLSWSVESLIVDGRSQGEIRQGVTTQIFGEGESMGPWTEDMKKLRREGQGDVKFDITWTTLAEYLAFLEKKGVAQNVASYIGAATVREHVIGLDNRAPTPAELEAMRALVRQEMEAGALGIGSSLIYAPAIFAATEELIELCKAAAPYQGKYISHIRSEGDRFEEAIDELIRIAREAKVPAEIYHLKAGGEANWPKMDAVIAKVEAARRDGLKITADMYTYTAGATGFDACLPPWVRDGGYEKAFDRLRDPALRPRIAAEIKAPGKGWENICGLAGSPERMLLLEFKSDALKPYTGKTLAEVARLRGKDWAEVILDLVVEDQTRVGGSTSAAARPRNTPPSRAACSRITCSVASRYAFSSTTSCSRYGRAPKAMPAGASTRMKRSKTLPADSSWWIASVSGTASRCATSFGIARSTNGNPSRSASRGPT